jgi:hypothetical protein
MCAFMNTKLGGVNAVLKRHFGPSGIALNVVGGT